MGPKAVLKTCPAASNFMVEAFITIDQHLASDSSGDAGLIFRVTNPTDGTDNYNGTLSTRHQQEDSASLPILLFRNPLPNKRNRNENADR